MTEEQIKQNAEKAVEKYRDTTNPTYCGGYKTGFIAGAHSRDEEIDELKHEVIINSHLRASCQEEVKELQKQLEKFSNPWISVEEQLPKEIETENYKNTINEKYEISKDVFVVDKCGNIGVGCYDHTRKFWLLPYYFRSDAEIVRWMPIPQIEKGE